MYDKNRGNFDRGRPDRDERERRWRQSEDRYRQEAYGQGYGAGYGENRGYSDRGYTDHDRAQSFQAEHDRSGTNRYRYDVEDLYEQRYDGGGSQERGGEYGRAWDDDRSQPHWQRSGDRNWSHVGSHGGSRAGSHGSHRGGSGDHAHRYEAPYGGSPSDTTGRAYSGGYTGASYGSDYREHGYGSRDDGRRGFLDRAGDEIASWFGDEDAARRREADHRGRGPRDYTRSDERIREDANDRLTEDWRVDASEITVLVKDGEVTLSGTVGDRQAKRRAEDVVENITGVKNVQNNLRVNQAGTGGYATGSGSFGVTGSARTVSYGADAESSALGATGLGNPRAGSTGTSTGAGQMTQGETGGSSSKTPGST